MSITEFVNAQNENKRLEVEKVIIDGTQLQLKMETILSGHQNWVTAAIWITGHDGNLQLGTCSMDKSVILWKVNEDDIWEDYCHLGEVGGGNLGFLGIHSGFDSERTLGVLAYSYTGSFHLWWFNQEEENWLSAPAPSGHYDQVRDIIWSPSGSYLLSTSYDQTTRLYAKVINEKVGPAGDESISYWAELARPQVHGHCLRCISAISDSSFVSGAEEKVIRVFRAPRNFIHNFENLTQLKLNVSPEELDGVPEGAAVPALGLSNKAIFDSEGKAIADREIRLACS